MNNIKNEHSKSPINRIDGQHNGMGVLLQKLTYLCFTNFQKISELVYSVVHLYFTNSNTSKAKVFLFVVKE